MSALLNDPRAAFFDDLIASERSRVERSAAKAEAADRMCFAIMGFLGAFDAGYYGNELMIGDSEVAGVTMLREAVAAFDRRAA